MKKVDTITLTVARNLADARRQKGWTQQDLAQKLGCSKHAVMTWETCRNEISNETLLKISEALDKKWLWFYQPQEPEALFVPTERDLEKADRRIAAVVPEPGNLTPEERRVWGLFNRFMTERQAASGESGGGLSFCPPAQLMEAEEEKAVILAALGARAAFLQDHRKAG